MKGHTNTRVLPAVALIALVCTVPAGPFVLAAGKSKPSKENAKVNAKPARKSGVTILKRGKCHGCYRLYNSRNAEVARMIDIDGKEVHRWAYPQGKSWHYAEMLPNGNLLAIIKDVMILELDFSSKLVWKMKTRAHHDFARLANGNTLVVSRRRLKDPWSDSGRRISFDVIYEQTPKNKTVWEWKVQEHARELAALVDVKIPIAGRWGDWPHINTCESLPDNPAAKKDPRFAAGNILICGRHIDTIAVIERKTGRIVWAWGPGEIYGPHMPTMLPDGHILLYDNGQNAETKVRGYTRVIEMDPLTGKIVWQYRADPPESFNSPSRGSNQRLPNGNTLIAETDSARLFEVTREGEIVWEFHNPDRAPIYRTVAYPRKMVDDLVARNAEAKPSRSR